MPTAPGLVPTAVPSGFAPNVDLPVPVDAFGGAIGHALSGLGDVIEQGSDRIWQRTMELQGLNNETEAKEADAKYMMQSGIMHADFINKEGLNAGPEALAQHIQQLQDLRTQIRSGISNPAAQRMYDASSLSFMGRNIFNAAGHSGQQMKVASNEAAQSRKEIVTNNIEANPDDEVSFQRGSRVIQSENASIGKNSGWSDEKLEATNEKDLSEYWGKRIIATANNNGALKAQQMLNLAIKNKAVDPITADKVQASITTKIGDQGSRSIANEVLADRRAGEEEDDVPVETYVQKGMDAVDAVKGINDDQRQYLRDRVQQAIVTKYKQQRSIETDTDNQNVRTIGRALVKANQEGQFPTTIEEMQALDPKIGPAWDAIQRDPRKAQAVLAQLEHNAAGSNKVPTTSANLILTHKYIGMSQSANVEDRASFMAQNFGADNRLSLPQRNHLMTLQDRLHAHESDDPRVERAMSILKPDMLAADYPVDAQKNKDDYFQFRGAVTDALNQFSHDHPGKLPTQDEVRQIGRQLMQEQHLSFYQFHQGFYQQTAPADVAEQIKKLPIWNGALPSTAEINRYYRADQYAKKYGKRE